MDTKGLILWIVFAAIFAAGVLFSRRLKRQIAENGIEAEGVISRVTDEGGSDGTDIRVYVRYPAASGGEAEALLSNAPGDLAPGQRVRIKYHPKLPENARLIEVIREP